MFALVLWFSLLLGAEKDSKCLRQGNRRRQEVRIPRFGSCDRPFLPESQAWAGRLWDSVQGRQAEAAGLSSCCEENCEGVQRRVQGLLRRSPHHQRIQAQESRQVLWLVLPGTQLEHSPFHVQLFLE